MNWLFEHLPDKHPIHIEKPSMPPLNVAGTEDLAPTWPPELMSGVPVMDRLHHDLLIALDALCGSDDVAFCTKFTAFVSQIEQAFRKEESWMDNVDLLTNAAHQEQHARTLAALHHIHALVMDGNLDIGRHVVKDLLPQWLSFHFSTMDATFALALQLTEMGREPSPLMI